MWAPALVGRAVLRATHVRVQWGVKLMRAPVGWSRALAAHAHNGHAAAYIMRAGYLCHCSTGIGKCLLCMITLGLQILIVAGQAPTLLCAYTCLLLLLRRRSVCACVAWACCSGQ